MIRRVGCLLLLLAVVGAAPASRAQVVSVPYPGLLGAYDSTPRATRSLTAPFQPSALVAALNTVSIRLIGSIRPGILADLNTGVESPYWAHFDVYLDHGAAGFWRASGTLFVESFDETLPFSYGGAGAGDLALLLDDTAQLTVTLQPLCVPDESRVVAFPTGALTGCEVLLDGLVAAEPATWGRIKGSYR
ncbi:MAG: hypothetical protein ACYDIE_00575 [Candidatus Krumholzibacteriia bacterium]